MAKQETKSETKSEKKLEIVVLKFQIHCAGCLKEIKRAILKLEGVQSIDYDLKENKVTLTGNINPQKVLKQVRKTGKIIELLQPKESKDADKKDSSKKEPDKKDSDKKDSQEKKPSGPPNSSTFVMNEDKPNKCECM